MLLCFQTRARNTRL